VFIAAATSKRRYLLFDFLSFSNPRGPDLIEKEIPKNTSKPHQTPTHEIKEKRTQTDKRIDYLLTKHFEDDPEFRPVISKLAEYDPTPNKKYLAWLVKHWCGKWNPDEAQLQRISHCLNIHHRGAKYFSPLTWTGLELEDVGYQADVFRFTPQTILQMQGKIVEIIQTDEENKQIRKGNLVATAGAEVAYQDDNWTLVRIRTNEALMRLGQGTSWCVRHGIIGGYRFPFDFLLSREGDKYLANANQVRDRWDKIPPVEIVEKINEIRRLGSDSGDKVSDEYRRFTATIHRAIQARIKLKQEEEEKLLGYPGLAIEYAHGVIGGRWPEFEQKIRVSDLSASNAVEYAIRCRRERWPRFENKIKRSSAPLARYREAFPGAIPKTEKELFNEDIQQWRLVTKAANCNPLTYGVQAMAEARVRQPNERQWLARVSEASVKRYAMMFASLVRSVAKRWYVEKLQSYFSDFESEHGQEVNLKIARLLCLHFGERMECLEPMIAKDATCSLNYALGMGERFVEGEDKIRKEWGLWEKHRKKILGESSVKQSPRGYQRLSLPTNVRYEWS
jgi:hypothetical protein